MGFVVISIIGVIIGVILLIIADQCWSSIIEAFCGITGFLITGISGCLLIINCIGYFTTTGQLNAYSQYHEYLHDTRHTDLSQTAIELKIMEYNKEIAEWKGSVEIAPWLYWKSDEIMNLEYFSLEEVNNAE